MAGRNRNQSQRTPVALSCVECGARNFKTTRSKTMVGHLKLNKFCPTCGRHTEHIESK